jgi:FMN phosphatase YigB (HAD superfamily)
MLAHPGAVMRVQQERESMPSASDNRTVNTVLFDFGGVLADEGFRNGLAALGRINSLPEEDIVAKGHELVFRTGYVTGRAEEGRWWDALRSEAGIRGTDETLRLEILDRFTLRPWILEEVQRLKNGEFTEVLFIDDKAGHVGRAVAGGWKAILYKSREDLLRELAVHLRGTDRVRQP